MPNIDEDTQCHFFDQECLWPIPEEALKELLEEAEEGDTIFTVPAMDDNICTNCMLAQVL